MQRKKLSTHSDEEEEEIQMDDQLVEEIEVIGNKNSSPSQIYNKNGFYKENLSPENKQDDQQPAKKAPQVISLELTNSPNNKQPNLQSGQSPEHQQQQQTQNEGIKLKEKLINIFTNIGTKNQNQQQSSTKINKGQLQLEDNLVENKQKKGEIHNFPIDNDMDLFEDDIPEKENDKEDKGYEQYKINNQILFESEQEMEIGVNSRKNSEDYIQIPDNKNNNYDMLGKQLTEYESQMQQIADKQKQQENDIQVAKKLLSHYDNVRIVKMEQFESSNMKEIHELNLIINKGNTINYDEKKLYKGTKEPKKKRGLLDYLTNRVTRYVLIHNEMIAFCKRNKKNDFVVCSAIHLQDLFQIYNDKNSTQIRFYFVNKKRDQYSMPINKLYNIDNKEQFLITLRNALNKIGLDYALK